jgi:hypothetical protein
MIEKASLQPFPYAAFVWVWIGFAVVWWSSIGTIVSGLIGLGFGAADVLLARNSQLVFEPSDAPHAEKQRFLRRTAVSQIAFTPLVILAGAYFLPKVTRFIFPEGWVQREPAVLYYLGGLGIAWAIASLIASRKFA